MKATVGCSVVTPSIADMTLKRELRVAATDSRLLNANHSGR